MAGRAKQAQVAVTGGEAQLPLAPKKKPTRAEKGETYVVIDAALKARIDASKDLLGSDERCGYVPKNYTEIVRHLLSRALRDLEAERDARPLPGTGRGGGGF